MPEMAGVEYHPRDLIAAVATAPGAAALAVIRTSGVGCIEALTGMFSKARALCNAPSHTSVYGHIVRPGSGEIIDDAVCVVYRETSGYTGEEAVEIIPHGSVPGVRMILETLFENGFRQAQPGEFSLRAFLNGKTDLARAEAVRELIESKTRTAHAIAVKRLTGEMTEVFHDLRSRLLDLIGPIELALDYPEEETGTPLDSDPFAATLAAELIGETEKIIDSFRIGRIYQEGYRVVVAGATNAGKSSLFNLLLREERSIVSDVHGTTRDYIESWIGIRELPVRLFDTAGLRNAAENIESEGIRRTESLLADADCILYLVDATAGESEEDRRVLNQLGDARCIRIWSKCDLTDAPPPAGYIAVSSIDNRGLPALEAAVFERAGGVSESDVSVYLESDHQKLCLTRFRDAILRAVETHRDGYALDAVATDLGDALDALGELTGDITSAEILDSIFSKFCVGK